MPHLPSIRIVIPACNEAKRIAPTLRDYCEYFGSRALIVVVANGCTDDTEGVVRELQSVYANLVLVSIAGRIGKGGAVRVGFSSGIEPIMCFADADGSTSAAQFSRLVEALEDPALQGVIGSRWSEGSVVRCTPPLSRRIASRSFNFLVHLLFDLRYRDTQCGAKVFKRSAVERVFSRLELSNFAFDIDLLHQLTLDGASIAELPIEWAETFEGSQVRLIPASVSMLAAILRLRFRDSIVARLPFFDYLARDSVIRVRQRIMMLVLSGAESPAGFDEIIRNMQAMGHDVRWIRDEKGSLFSRARLMVWYALFGRRQYDAVVEVSTNHPFLIPAVSAKPSFLVSWGSAPGESAVAARIYRRWYRRVLAVDCSAEGKDYRRIADELVLAINGDSEYLAIFDRLDEDWSLHFTDMATGVPRRERL